MSSGTSTDGRAVQPWHFFAIVTLLAATAAVLMARQTSFANLLLVSFTVMAAGLVGIAAHRTLSPLARADDATALPAVGGRTRLALAREKALVLRSIKELEFDRAMGKIGENDFEEMVTRLRARAIGLMRQLDETSPGWRTEIEQELARRRAAGGTRATAPPPAGLAASDTAACRACGTRNDEDARFCKGCGARLTSQEAAPA